MSQHSRPLWHYLSAVLIGLPVLYLLSVLPLLWLLDRPHTPHYMQVVAYFYTLPLLWSRENGPQWWKSLVQAYINLWFS